MEGAKREQEERRKREEQEEVARLRKAAVHKAQPIRFAKKWIRKKIFSKFPGFRNYKPVEVKPSEKPLTHPSSPKFLSGTSKAMNMNTTYSNN